MMNVWGMTDIGLVRRENQDAYAVYAGEETGFTICVVCDGMGGPGGGRLASRLAVDAFLSACRGNLRREMDWEQVREVTAFAVAEANAAVYERSCSEEGLRGMGTTLVSAVVREGEALLDNVGDSRAYLVHNGGISRITRDHSVVERLVEQGDCLLLCTDGLTGTVTDQELADEILRGTEDNQCLDRLLALAKSQGAPDNVTAVLLRRQ